MYTRQILEVVDAWDGSYDSPSPANRKIRGLAVLENDLLEKVIGTSPWWLAGLWFLPVISFCLYLGITDPAVGILGTAWRALAGVLFWTLIEYILHRWLFHLPPPSTQRGRFLFFVLHGYHHEFPNDHLRLVMPATISWPGAVIFAGLFWATGITGWVAILGGFMIGYLAYDWVHYYTHHARPTTRVGKFLRRYHMEHHFKDSTTHYGLSSPLWDIILGTFTRPEAPGQLEIEITGRSDG